MIRALTGIVAAAICMMLAGCGAQGEQYQRRADSRVPEPHLHLPAVQVSQFAIGADDHLRA